MTVRFVTSGPHGDAAWEVDADPAMVTVGELARSVGVGGGCAEATPPITVDGRPVDGATTIAAAGILDGARLDLGGPAPEPSHPTIAAARLDLVAGLGAGSSVTLPAGRFAIGPALATSGATVDVGLVDAARLIVEPEPGGGSRILVAAGAVFRVGPPLEPAPRPVSREARGGVTLHRAPAAAAPIAAAPPEAPPLPSEPPPSSPFSWATLLAPLPVALVMSVIASPRFVLLAVASPLLAIGRWVESRLRHRRRAATRARAIAAQRADYAWALGTAADAEVARRWVVQPDPAALAIAARRAAAPTWQRRTRDDDALELVIGAGVVPWRADRPNARDASNVASIGPVPIVVPLRDRRAIGVVGPATAAIAVARWLVADAMLLHGPADVLLAAALAPDHGDPDRTWGWLKWLPHLVDRSGSRRLATTVDETGALVAALDEELGPPAPRTPHDRYGIVVVGTPDLARAPRLRDALVRTGSPLRAIVVAGSSDELPAWCDVVAEIDGDGVMTIVGAHEQPIGPATATGVTMDWASETARALSRLADPELIDRPMMPHDVRLTDLLAVTDLLHAPDDLAARLAQKWTGRPTSSMATPIGMATMGPLVLDLLADGPHALVAGTTGAGKSELLRSWIAGMATSGSPDDLNFVLVDFKGGGAFDVCADLPHTVAVVTDLDAHLAARALRCLRAEVRHREGRLRAAGCSDLARYASTAAAAADPLPRLVVVVDEFATLVAELPDFVSSIVDIAQRGRSLGIHLVLATQRPTGVVDNKVRANTNLRIALRVQDDGDSLDVVGIADAARVSRRTPGRAHLRLGAGDVTQFQAALVTRGEEPPHEAARRAVARPFTLFAADRGADDGSTRAPHGPSDLERLTGACRIAARLVGCRPPRMPWPPPLPTTIDAVHLWATAGREPWTVPLGLADEPDDQRQPPWRWRAVEGGLVVYGAVPADTTRVLTTLAFGLANDHPVDAVHLYAVGAGSGGGLAAVADLPHCGSLVHAADAAGVARVLDTIAAIVGDRRALVRGRRITAIGPGDHLPLVVLLVDDIGAVLEALDADDEREASAQLAALVRDGASVGVVTAMAASHERALPSRLATTVSQRITLRMADPTSYLALGLTPRTVPSLTGLRGVVLGTATDVHCAELTDPTAMARSIAAQVATGTSTSRPPRRVRKLEAVVRLDDVGGDAGRLDDHTWSLTVAATASLRPVRLELRPGIDALVAGPPGSGRSTALVAIARAALAATAGNVHLVRVTPRRSPLAAAIGDGWHVDDADALDAAVAAAANAPTLVLVDDAEHVAAALGQGLGRLAERPRDHVRLVVAGRADVLRAPGTWTASLRHGRTGIALDPAPGDGDIFRTTFPRRSPVPPGQGRGFVIALGSATAAQILVAI